MRWNTTDNREGRTRLKDTSFIYDYFIKDHLGNTRVVLTDELRTDMYPSATMEDVTDVNSIDDPDNYVPYYSNTDYIQDADCRYPISGIEDYPTYEGQTDPNNYVAKVGGEKTIGPGITLKVMAGDRFNVKVESWYKMDNEIPDDPTTVLGTLAMALANGIEKTGGSKYTAQEILERETLDPGLTGFFASQSGYDDSKPKAFINWVLFDERYKYVSSSSGFDQVGNDEVLATHYFTDMPIDKNGYLYIYVSNETPNIDVFFDNLQITHIRGPLIEETHYYPFGVPMAGISSKTLGFGTPFNKYKFNSGSELASKEFHDGGGLGIYETFFRGYDAQIGRFQQIDPLSEVTNNWTLYAFCNNNPILYSDPYGADTTVDGILLTDSEYRSSVTVVSSPKKDPPPNISTGSPPYPLLPLNPLYNSDYRNNLYVAHSAQSTATETDKNTVPYKRLIPLIGSPAGVIIGTVLPLYGGLAPGTPPIVDPYDRLPVSHPLPWHQPYPGHGNRDENWNYHIVYYFTYNPPAGRSRILKWGISDYTRNAQSRPENQLAYMKRTYDQSAEYHVYARVKFRLSAKTMERYMVSQHFNRWGYKPIAQDKPEPLGPISNW